MSPDAFAINALPRRVYTIPHDATLDVAVALLRQRGVHHLVVTQDGAPVGVVSDSDLLRVGLPDPAGGWCGALLVSAATHAIVPAGPEDALDVIIDTMLAANASAIPVVDPVGGRLVGVLTVTDLVRLLRGSVHEDGDARAVLQRLVASPVVQGAITLLTEAGL